MEETGSWRKSRERIEERHRDFAVAMRKLISNLSVLVNAESEVLRADLGGGIGCSERAEKSLSFLAKSTGSMKRPTGSEVVPAGCPRASTLS